MLSLFLNIPVMKFVVHDVLLVWALIAHFVGELKAKGESEKNIQVVIDNQILSFRCPNYYV